MQKKNHAKLSDFATLSHIVSVLNQRRQSLNEKKYILIEIHARITLANESPAFFKNCHDILQLTSILVSFFRRGCNVYTHKYFAPFFKIFFKILNCLIISFKI